MTLRPYTFRATLDHAWDGDTIWLRVDRGEGWSSLSKYRLYGVDTPEIRGASDEEEEYARKSKEFVESLLADRDFVISTHKGKSKYDWMAEVFLPDKFGSWLSLTHMIIAAGHGVPYGGGTKLSWPERKALQDKAAAD